jgi:hypothetical protein
MTISDRKTKDLGHASDVSLMPEDVYPLLAGRRRVKFTAIRQGVAIALLVTIITVLNVFTPAHTTYSERLYGSVMFAILAVPIWLWRLGIDPNPPFIALLSLIYFYLYGFGVFMLKAFPGNMFQADIAPRWIEAAMRLSLAGMVLMLAGYYAWPWMPIRSMVPRFRMRWSDARAVRLAGFVMAIFGLLFSATRIPGMPKFLAQVTVYAEETFTVGICILIGLWSMDKLSRRSACLLFLVLVPARLGIGLLSGLASGAMEITFTLILMYAALARRIPWGVVLAGTAAIFIIRPMETPYRVAAWSAHGELYNASRLEKAQYMCELIYRNVVEGATPRDELIQVAAGRLSLFPTFADVMSQTPSIIPYWGGTTYYPLLFKPIPRVIWPGKPEEVTGSTFGNRYGFSVVGSATSINLPQLIEQYANFGVFGVLIGMFVIGMIYRMLLAMFIHPEMGLGALVAAVFVTSSLFDLGSATSAVFGGIPWTLIYLFVVDRFVLLLHFELSGVDERTFVTAEQ